MANVNIPDLTQLTNPATADEVEVYDASASQNKRLALSHLVRGDGSGAQITGAGTIALGGFTLTVPATGTAALLGAANVFTQAQIVRLAGAKLTVNSTSNNPALNLSVNDVDEWGLYYNNVTGYFAIGETGVADRFIIKDGGNVGIGITSPSAQLHINQSSASGAKPTLRLRQADLSEEFIRFESTVGTGNAINTTALGTYYGRVRVLVEGVGEKWLALYNT